MKQEQIIRFGEKYQLDQLKNSCKFENSTRDNKLCIFNHLTQLESVMTMQYIFFFIRPAFAFQMSRLSTQRKLNTRTNAAKRRYQ